MRITGPCTDVICLSVILYRIVKNAAQRCLQGEVGWDREDPDIGRPTGMFFLGDSLQNRVLSS
jgi:hypothetical protein